MIIVNLKGGLGNQMFQFAAGKALSIKNNDTLKIDISSLSFAKERGYIHRDFDLQYFNTGAEVAELDEVNPIRYPKGYISKILEKINTKIFKKYYVAFDEEITQKTGDIYLNGYFQSEKYFENYKDQIRECFTLNHELRGGVNDYLKKIKDDPFSVSIHIRRGDYVHNPEFGGVCTNEYYKNAKELILKSIPNANFYIFSDDVNWVQQKIFFGENMNYLHSYYPKDSEELYIMSCAKHHIISNSSFGWWGAWLGTNEDKIVIAPKEWVNKGKERFKDIVPETWIRI